MSVLIGVVGLGRRREALGADGAAVVELAETFHQRLRPATLARWRADLPDTLRLVLRAASDVTHPRQRSATTGHFRETDEVEAAWVATVDAARAAQAKAVVFRTPASFSPTKAHREALQRFSARAAADLPGVSLVWEPVGLWEDEEASELAAEAGLVLAVDPQRTPPPPGEVAYCRLAGPLGVRGRYDDLDLLEVLRDVADRPCAYLVFDHPAALRDARRLAALAAEAGMAPT